MSVILSAKRTPVGSFQGYFKTIPAPVLGGAALKAAVDSAGIDPPSIDEVIMGCVLTGGLGQSPARQAMLNAGIPDSVGSLTINRVCSSGSKAVMMADQMIRCGDAKLIAAGGMESMTNAPYVIPKARAGLRLGDAVLVDSMVHDGLWDAHSDQHMGSCAEMCAETYGLDRTAQDAFALESYERARKAIASGILKDEIVPIEVIGKTKKVTVVDGDEEPGRLDKEKMKTLKTAFKKDGTITPANASSISDGAAALVIASEEYAKQKGLKTLARIVAHGGFSQQPEWFTTAPIGAIKNVLDKAGWKVGDVDLWEINEAFSCVPMAIAKEFKLDMKRVNIHGGAVAIGHPIGCSGARILVTLIHAMKHGDVKKGMIAICNGGGEATAIAVERVL
jgi:acetyl-CoA C-acetyltransferase